MTLTAEVTIRPGDRGSQICRSLIDPSQTPTPAFVVSAPAPTGVEPQVVFNTTLSETFPLDRPVRAVLVYSAGVDGPAKTEVTVSETPPTPRPSSEASVAEASTAAAPAGGVKEATGWSSKFVYEEALADAIEQLRAAVGFTNPDIGLSANVVASGVQVGGFTVHRGLFVTLRHG